LGKESLKRKIAFIRFGLKRKVKKRGTHTFSISLQSSEEKEEKVALFSI
jgi:hypothetical protein